MAQALSEVKVMQASGTQQAATPQGQHKYQLSPFVLKGLMSRIQRGTLYVNDKDGKVYPVQGALQPLRMDFIVVRMDPWFRCWWRHEILFKEYGLLPPECLQCWKVVVRPRKLQDLMEVYAYQLKKPVSCKCGLESRAYIRGLWGAYWYNKSKDAGEQMWRTVQSDLGHLDMEIFLKRGCTEFEMAFGDSQNWEEVVKQQDGINKEAAIAKYMGTLDAPTITPDLFIAAVIEQWYNWAGKYGKYHDDDYSMSRGLQEVKVRKYRDSLIAARQTMGPRSMQP